MLITTYIILSLAVSVLIVVTSFLYNTFKFDQGVVVGILSSVATIHGLLIAFTIANFYNRYIEIKNYFDQDAADLEQILLMVSNLQDSKHVIDELKNYLKDYIDKLFPSIKNGTYNDVIENIHLNMKSLLTKYSKQIDLPYSSGILSRIPSSQKISDLIPESKTGNYYILIITFLLIPSIILLWLLNGELYSQIIFTCCLMIIFGVMIYMLMILNNVFDSSPIQITDKPYVELYNRFDRVVKS